MFFSPKKTPSPKEIAKQKSVRLLATKNIQDLKQCSYTSLSNHFHLLRAQIKDRKGDLSQIFLFSKYHTGKYDTLPSFSTNISNLTNIVTPVRIGEKELHALFMLTPYDIYVDVRYDLDKDHVYLSQETSPLFYGQELCFN